MKTVHKIFLSTTLSILLATFLHTPVQAVDCPTLSNGSVFKTNTGSAVWHKGTDGFIRYFPHASVFLARGFSFSSVRVIDQTCFSSYRVAVDPPYGINFPQGSLVKRTDDPTVYIVGENESVYALGSEAVAKKTFGLNWSSKVKDIHISFWPNYKKTNKVFTGEQSFNDSFLETLIDSGSEIDSDIEDETDSVISAAWANDGGEKIIQSLLRGTKNPEDTKNSVWNGKSISLFGARNEVVSANIVLEASEKQARNLDIRFTGLYGPNGTVLRSDFVDKDELFDWTQREIELFYVRYLEIKGLSSFCCNVTYDERHAPVAFRRPFDISTGIGSGTWFDRPHHNALYPEIAVPLELERPFTIEKGKNQSIWMDIYIPKNSPAGVYTGIIEVVQGNEIVRKLPISLDVKNITLPDEPTSKTLLAIGEADVHTRFFGESYPADSIVAPLRDQYFRLAHRHKITLTDAFIDANNDRPRSMWIPRLDGSLYTAANGYAGPGAGVGENVFVIGLYSSWPWKGEGKEAMWNRTNNWESWFREHAPSVERFLYLIDESHDYEQIQTWATWMNENPGIGKHIESMATLWVADAIEKTPALDIVASTMYVAAKEETQAAVDQVKNNPNKKIFFYNGGRPGQGSFMIEDDGIALREVAWGQYKKGLDRWFYWSGTYYDNYQFSQGPTRLFSQAHTFGKKTGVHSLYGETGALYSNGDGVLFYPGTDRVYPDESYGVFGPIASLRLKYWRRGIQDVDYIALAMKKDPAKTQAIIKRIVPTVLWEYGVDDLNDPTWKRTDISWSDDPDVWEQARAELADIILQQ